jgi:hypothetical protein
MTMPDWPGSLIITTVLTHKGKMTGYKYIVCLAGVLFVLSADLHAQSIPVAKNIDITIEQNRAIIHYDIISKIPGSVHHVDLKFLDEDYRLVTPSLLSGDIGSDISGKLDRKIEWDISNDVQLLGSNITPVLFVDWNSKQFSSSGGPRNALLSFLLPGLGDYFVADTRMMTFKPYMRTISSLGFIALGFWAGEQRYYAEGEYQTVAHQTLIEGSQRRYETTFYQKYIEGDIQYQFFKGDQVVFIGLGAAIWAADILWVLAKGSNNVKFMNATLRGSDFNLGYIPGGAAMQFSYTF